MYIYIHIRIYVQERMIEYGKQWWILNSENGLGLLHYPSLLSLSDNIFDWNVWISKDTFHSDVFFQRISGSNWNGINILDDLYISFSCFLDINTYITYIIRFSSLTDIPYRWLNLVKHHSGSHGSVGGNAWSVAETSKGCPAVNRDQRWGTGVKRIVLSIHSCSWKLIPRAKR